MKQVSAKVINNKRILKELERRRYLQRPQPRDILGSYLLWLNCPEIAWEAKPGQFVMVRCGGECVLPRPFSIHQIEDGNMALFYAVWEGGKGTDWLSQRRRGSLVEMAIPKPLGNGFSIQAGSHNLLLVAGGIGIAPLCFLAQRAISDGYAVTLLQGASGEWKSEAKKNPPQLYPKKLLPAGIEVETITSSTDGRRNMVTDLISKHIDGADQIFACGPMAMYRDMARKKQELKLEGKSVQVSLEVRMGCGRGVCYGCTIKTKNGLKRVCEDGPVFDLDDVLWEELEY